MQQEWDRTVIGFMIDFVCVLRAVRFFILFVMSTYLLDALQNAISVIVNKVC